MSSKTKSVKTQPTKRYKGDKEDRLARWLDKQLIDYKNKTGEMKNPEIYQRFTQFLEEYKEYFPENKTS